MSEQELNTLTGGEDANLDISADLIRGHINTIILRCLYDGDKYGYDIINEIEKKSGGLYSLKQPTLYSALKRLETLKYVTSYYGDYSNGGRRKYFSLTDSGRTITEKNLAEWEYSRTIIDSLISDGDAHYDFSFITDKQAELNQLKATLTSREQALEEQKIALQNLKNELQRERTLLSAQSSSLSSQKEDYKEWKEKIELQSKALEEKEEILLQSQAEIDAKSLLLSEQEEKLALLQSQYNELQIENNRLKEEATTLSKEEIEAVQKDINEKNLIIENLKKEIEAQAQMIDSLKAEAEKKATEYYNKQIELQAEQAKIQSAQVKLELDKQAFEEKIKELETLQQTLADKEAQISKSTESLNALEEERLALQEQLSILEVERATLRGDNQDLETQKAEFETQKKELFALQTTLQEERAQIDKQKYELTQREFALQEKQRNFESKQSIALASSAECDLLRKDLEQREAELARSTEKLQEDIASLTEQQKDLSNRQTVYNEQQLDFIARKNALSAQQFDFADKLSAYNAQVKTYNENLEKLEQDRFAFMSSKEQFDERVQAFETEKADFENYKSNFEKERAEIEKMQIDSRQRISDDNAMLQQQFHNLHERESEVARKEIELNTLLRQHQNRQFQQNPLFGNSYQGSSQQNYYSSPTSTPIQQKDIDYTDLINRANMEGIRVNTAGNMQSSTPYLPQPATTPAIVEKANTYNKGLTLFKSAFIVFCIIIFEALCVFFAKDYLGVSIVYPIVGFVLGFVMFILCAILYAIRYKPQVRLKKHASYISTAFIIFVIATLILSMVAVYLKANLTVPAQLLSYFIIPTVYLLNMVFFVLFYHSFSKKG